MSEWQNVKIKDVLDKIIGGGTPSMEIPTYWGGNIFWCSVKDMPVDRFKLSVTKDKITPEGLNNSSTNLIPKNTVIISTRMGLGKAFINEVDMAINQDLKALIPNSKINNKYLLWTIIFYKNYIEMLGNGSTVRGIRLETLKNIKIKLPPLLTQQKIVKILSNYEDLIENNLKYIKLLEESAQLKYEEWFLRFRINGKKLNIDQTSGLPLDWKKIKVKDYVSIISKGPSLNYNLGTSKGVEVINQSCIRNSEIEIEKVLTAKELDDNKKSAYLKINDILINSMGQGTLGRVSKNVSVDTKMIIHNCITFLRAKDKYSQFMLFYFISSHQKYFETIAHGSTGQSTLNKDLISNLMITLPDNKTINSFDLFVAPIWSKVGILKKQNQLLKDARDVLLPYLLTDVIDIKKMDIAI
jgi:type I restriction enzyme, S subunit